MYVGELSSHEDQEDAFPAAVPIEVTREQQRHERTTFGDGAAEPIKCIGQNIPREQTDTEYGPVTSRLSRQAGLPRPACQNGVGFQS
jgi:hypothetical protein